MKQFVQISLLLIFTITFLSSCKKDTESRLPGDWSSTRILYVNGEVMDSKDAPITFFSDGRGNYDGGIFKWSANESTFTYIVNGDGTPVEFQIITNEKKKQVFEIPETTMQGAEGVEFSLSQTWTLTR